MPSRKFIAAARGLLKSARNRFGVTGMTLIGLLLVIEAIATGMLFSGETPFDRHIFEKLEAKQRLSVHDWIVYGTWAAKLSIAVICAILLALSWFWARELPKQNPTTRPRRTFPAGFVVGIVLAVVLAAAWRAPRLDHSLWNDEELAVRKYIVGIPLVDPQTDELKFNVLPWERTLFYSLNGQNHTVQSIVSRLSHSLWKLGADDQPAEFSETALRMGSFLAGLATIALLGFWLAREGHYLAGVTAAFVLALNPWHIRYSVEVRGYAMLLLFMVAVLYCVRPALETNRWRYWLVFGITEALALLSFAGSLFFFIPLNLVILLIIAQKRDRLRFWRWFFVSAVGAILVDFFMLPTVIGFMGWLSSLNESAHDMSLEYLREFGSHLAYGISWNSAQPDLELGIGTSDLASANSLVKILILIVIPLFGLVGTVFAVKRSISLRIFGAVLGITLVTLGIYSHFFSESPFHVWYALYAVLWFAVALGFLGGVLKTSGRRFRRAFGWLPVIIVVMLYAWGTRIPRENMASFDRHPMRQVVAKVRGPGPPNFKSADNLTTLAIGSGAKQFTGYDPRVLVPKNLIEFEKFVVEAARKNHRLAVYVTGPSAVRSAHPDILSVLENSGRFENDGLVKAIEEFWTIQIFRMKP